MLIAAALLWSTAGLFIKWIDWSAMGIAGSRSLVAALTVFILVGGVTPKFNSIAWAGGVAYAATVTLFVMANKLTSVANAIFLQYTAPFFIAILGAWFLGERATKRDWIFIAIAQLGIAMFFMDHLSFQGLWGNLCALASGLAYASLVVLLRKQKDAAPIQSVIIGNLLTAFICLPFASGPFPEWKGWLGILFLGTMQLGLSYYLYSKAICHIPALDACLISLIEPVFSPILALLFIGEVPALSSMVGGLIILAASTSKAVLNYKRPQIVSRI